ncbi:hypothetical protein QR46_0003 [Giardia duodenalis assemblage B]|uniref:Uncharacterized protein n=2 Tax=Giardia intestinalis TaxID=5741 RepID=A0A132P0K7_GIAIN|nr:Hypothetical protein GL50581_746 [Giardia intestinalis ATCC 50581]KWX15865.1 hypothetical protein QR46_0003 [Giardia intestinalis assemblage B]
MRLSLTLLLLADDANDCTPLLQVEHSARHTTRLLLNQELK